MEKTEEKKEKKVEQKEGNSAYLDEIYQKTKKDDI